MSIDSIRLSTDAGTSTIARTIVLDALPAAAAPEQKPADDRVAQRQQMAKAIRPPVDDTFAFEEDDFLDSAAIEALANRLISDWPELRHIADSEVKYAWKRKGCKSKGALVLGKCVPLSGPAKHFGQAEFLIWLAADHVRDAAFGDFEIEALVYHELKHIGCELDEDEESPTYGELLIKPVGHDVEGFYDEIRRYGTWTQALRNTDQEFKQLALVGEEARS